MYSAQTRTESLDTKSNAQPESISHDVMRGLRVLLAVAACDEEGQHAEVGCLHGSPLARTEV